MNIMPSEKQQFEPNKYSVNQAIGKYPGIGWIPVNQLFYWVLIATLVFGLQILLQPTSVRFSLQTAFFTCGTLCLAYWALTGAKEYQFLDRFRALDIVQTTWIRARVRVKWISAGLPTKEQVGNRGNLWQRILKKSEVFTAIEDYSDLISYGQINLTGHKPGFYLLKSRQGQLRFVFKWHIKGPHPTLSEEDAAQILTDWASGIREFPPGEESTIEQSSFALDQERQAELDQLLLTDNPLSHALIYSQKTLTRQLTSKGIRSFKQTTITATFTPLLATREDRDLISRLLKGIVQTCGNFWGTFKGQKEELNHQRLHKLVTIAFNEGFLRAHSIFTTIMKLDAQPFTAIENWSSDYAFFHTQAPPPIPQLLILDAQGLRTEALNPHLHASTVLFQGERGSSSVPVKNPEWVYLPCHKKYVGFMQLERVLDFGSAQNKVRHLWNILARERVYDCRIVTQFTVGNRALQKFNLERSTRNATEVSLRAMRGRTVDVAANEQATQAILAQKALQQGDSVVYVASGIFLHRNNPIALNQDFAYLRDCFPGTEPYRERNIVPRIWLQSLPYVDESFLQLPYERRDAYLSGDATGLLNLASTKVLDDKGLELIALEGGSPVFLDAFNPDKHLRLCILAEPRSGKSLFQADYAAQAYLRGQPVIGFDVPRPTDGTSTYHDLVERIAECGGKAAYYDSGSKSNNLLHLYDFSGLPKASERQQGLLDLRIKATTAIGMGDVVDPRLEQATHSIVTQSLADFDAQPEIKERFALANRAGIGTQEWKNSPTYHDYAAFLAPWLENYFKENVETLPAYSKEAGGMLLEQLRACLKGKIGRAIASPSDFASDNDMLIFAVRGLDTNYQARLMAMAGYAALLARALTTEVSHFLMDETPLFFRFPAISQLIGELCANGAKWGVRVIISGQNAETIFRSAAGPQIFQTLNAVMVGRIAANAKNSFAELLQYDPQMLDMCVSENFQPSSSALRSHWLLYVNGSYIPCGHYPSSLLLSLTANNLAEAAARKRVMEQYSGNPVKGILEFSKLYTAARRSGTPMSQIQPNLSNPSHLRAVS